MKITCVINQYPTSSETFIYTLIENLQHNGIRIKVLTRRKGRRYKQNHSFRVSALPDESLFIGFRLPRYLYLFLLLVILQPRLFWQWFCFLRAKKANLREKLQSALRCLPVLASNSTKYYFAFGGLAVLYLDMIRFIPDRCYFSLRGSDIHIEPLLDETYRHKLREALDLAAGVHCVCEEIRNCAEELAGHPLSNARVIYTAVNNHFLQTPAKQVYPKPSNEPWRIISVGRLDWRKGFEHGMMAIYELKKRGYNIEWRIYGEGPHRTCLEHAIRDLGLEKVVFLTGKVDQLDLLELLKEGDIFFLPTIIEGISNAALEAMALGLPVVATEVGGMAEAIQHKTTGLLAPPRDWRKMAENIEQIMTVPDLFVNLAQAASYSVREKFTLEQQIKEFQVFFKVKS